MAPISPRNASSLKAHAARRGLSAFGEADERGASEARKSQAAGAAGQTAASGKSAPAESNSPDRPKAGGRASESKGARSGRRRIRGNKGDRAWIVSSLGGARALGRIAALCVLQSLMAANAVVFALLMQRAVDAAASGSESAFTLAVTLFAAALAAQVALRAANRAFTERTRSRFENNLRLHAFAGVLNEPYAESASRHTADSLTRMTSDVAVVADGACSLAPTGVSMGVRLVGVFGALFALVPEIAAAFLVAGCIAGIASIAVRPLLKRLHRRMQEAEGSMRGLLQDSLESLIVVRSFGRERKMERAAEEAMDAHRAARVRKADTSNACSTAVSLAVQAAYVAGFAYCGAGILAGTCTYGTLIAVVQLIGQIQSPFTSLGGSFSRYSAMLASAERLRELDTVGASVSSSEAPDEPRVHVDRFESIKLEGISFGYDHGAEVLSGCSFELCEGEFVGLSGPSGQGKSTLLKIMLGALTPSAGSALLRLADGRSVPLSQVEGLFAYVPQGNMLMCGTIAEIVAFAEDGAPCEARVREALRTACALEFTDALPRGIHTPLGQKGAGLSEGQMQRIAVARAVYSGYPVLLLDEATSALDAETEREMLARLRALPNRSAVVVTHRAATLQACDRLVQLHGERGHSA